jgi:hypothetical protein
MMRADADTPEARLLDTRVSGVGAIIGASRAAARAAR